MKTESNKIFGAPGTGKTTTLINIIINSNIPLNKICYCTFGKKALEDMKARMYSLGSFDMDLPYFKTIHAMNFKLLGIKMGQIADKKLDEFCKQKRINLTLKFKPTEEITFINTKEYGKSQTLDDIFHAQMQEDRIQLRPFNFIHPRVSPYAGAYMNFKHAYFDWMKENDYIDFIGMIEQGIERNVCPPVDMICVDEWQDLNPLQIKQVQMWISQIPLSYHAGDDDQNIFSFAGSDPTAFLKLSCDNETVLRETFRLPADVLALSQELIKRNTNRKDKDIHTKKPAGGIYVKNIRQTSDMLKELPRNETCYILVRNNFVIQPLMSDLMAQGVPLVGLTSEKNAVKLIHKGIGQKNFHYDEIEALCDGTVFPVARYFKKGAKTKLKKALQSTIPNEGYTIEQMKNFGLKDQFFIDLTRKDCSNLNIKPETLDYIVKLFEKYGYNYNTVQIMTIHQAKGLEADTVVLVPDITKVCAESEEGRSPNRDAREEERRNWYTACTRARKRLIMLSETGYSNYKTRFANIVKVFVENQKKNA